MNIPVGTIYEGDCLDVMREISSQSVHLIITSPPYATQRAKTYGGIPPEKYGEWFLPRAQEMQRILHPRGTFVLNIKEHATQGERSTYVIELILALKKQGWLWTEEFVWHKRNCFPGKWPNRFRDAWERLLQFNLQKDFAMHQDAVRIPIGDWSTRLNRLTETDRKRKPSQVGSPFSRARSNWEGRETVYPTNVLHLATECGNKHHSAAFPESLPTWFIQLFTEPNDSVLDPFAGSGTTILAALKLHRNGIGIECDPDYVSEAKKRIAQYQTSLVGFS